LGNNQFLSEIMYNSEFKERFLQRYKDNTSRFYKYIFLKSYKTENDLKKDIYDFDNIELDSLIKEYNNASIQSVQSVVSVLKQYLDFCIDQGFININYLQGIGTKEDFMRYLDVNAQNKKIITKLDLEDICNRCENPQDAICFALPFYGIKGEKCEEIINLKVTDCDFNNNKLLLTSNQGELRYVENLPDFLMELLKDAIEKKEYVKNNGEESVNMKAKTYNIKVTPYVFRISARENSEDQAKFFNVTSRINRIKLWYGNPYITITNLWISGMIDMAKKIKEEKGELIIDDYIEINKYYNYPHEYVYKTRARVEQYL